MKKEINLEEMKKEIDKAVSAYLASLGRKGGKIGGKRSLETMTPEQRTERAKIAAAKSAEIRSEKSAAKKRTIV
ncbi:MAG: hypothetical protein ACJ8BW_13705 [Ktedonobacteraceae bacterium]|jgi:hypothetical protein